MMTEVYKRRIVELVENATNAELLELIYRFCKRLLG